MRVLVKIAAWASFGSEHPRTLTQEALAARSLALNRDHSGRARPEPGPEQVAPLESGARCPSQLGREHQAQGVFLRATLPPRHLSDTPTLFPSAAQHRLSGTRQSARRWHEPLTQSASERPSNAHRECEQGDGGDTLADGDTAAAVAAVTAKGRESEGRESEGGESEGGLSTTCGFVALDITHLDGTSTPPSPVDPEPHSHDLPPGPDLPLHPACSAHLKYYHVQSTTCAETQNTAVGLAMAAMEALLSPSPRHTSAKPTYQDSPQGH